MTTQENHATRPAREWPDDLRRVVGERRLVELALGAAQIGGEALPRPDKIAEDPPSPRMLLALLTYCYTAGIYGSEDVEWACETDGGARYLCANIRPDQEVIRRFRRANRPWIEACLAWVHGMACAAPESSADLHAFVREKLELAIMMDMATADC